MRRRRYGASIRMRHRVRKVPEIASFGRGSESAIGKSEFTEKPRPQGAIFLVYPAAHAWRFSVYGPATVRERIDERMLGSCRYLLRLASAANTSSLCFAGLTPVQTFAILPVGSSES